MVTTIILLQIDSQQKVRTILTININNYNEKTYVCCNKMGLGKIFLFCCRFIHNKNTHYFNKNHPLLQQQNNLFATI